MDKHVKCPQQQEESAPVFFHVSSESSDLEEPPYELGGSGNDSYESEQCPLCHKLKKVFLCQDCLLRGDFKSSKSKYKTKFVDLKLNYLNAKRKRLLIIEECEKYTEKKEQIASIVEEIIKIKNKIAIEKELKSLIELKITNAQHESELIEQYCNEKSHNWPLYRTRLDNMAKQYEQNLVKLNRYKEVNESQNRRLKNVSKSRIIRLKESVFNFQEVDTTLRNSTFRESTNNSSAGEGGSWSDEEDDTVRSLILSVANASSSSNYWGRPEDLVSTFGTCYSIASPNGPTLPLSGDYSAWAMWANKREVSGGNYTYRNPAHQIEASLTYITQFVNLVAYFLDLRLPHRLSFSEFTNGDLLGSKFTRKVAKLNANIINLCASQGIPSSFLEPRRTISNLLLLFDPEVSDLGRRGPFEMSPQLAKSMEESIEKDLIICEDEESDFSEDWTDSFFPSDWENVQRGTLSDVQCLQNLHNQSFFQNMNPQMISQQQNDMSFTRSKSANAISGAGGLLSSFSSFFKWGK